MRRNSAPIALPSGVLAATASVAVRVLRGLWAGASVGVLAVVLGVPMQATVMWGAGVLVLAVVPSIVVHEVGHVIAYRLLCGRAAPALLVVRGIDVRLIRRAGRRRHDAVIAASGGLAVLASAALVVPATLGSLPGVALVWMFVGLGHVAALAVPVGDGLTLWRALRRPAPAA
jgi:hypothetical protein